jgi:16S rRNA (uracil1498-N3)-methyltransferase
VHRFYVPPERLANEAALTGREWYHASKVLRLRRDDELIVLDGVGRELLCRIAGESKEKFLLEVRSTKQILRSHEVTLVQALPKGKIIESIIQKATELGVTRIVPLLSERVASDPDHERAAKKTEKWQAIAIEAMKQCGTAWLPMVEPLVTLEKAVKSGERHDLTFVASLEGYSLSARHFFDLYLAESNKTPQRISIWIGPEGDFTPAEYKEIRSTGAQPVTLGSLVLRVETAAVCALSIINYEMRCRTEKPGPAER